MCCSSFYDALPSSSFYDSLPIAQVGLIRSMVIAVAISTVLFIYGYKKRSGKSLKIVLHEIFNRVFFFIPFVHHSESDSCTNPDCVRCKKYFLLKLQIVEKWVAVDTSKLTSKRLEEAVRTIGLKKELRDKIADITEGKSKIEGTPALQNPTIFFMNDLAANPIWTDFEVLKADRSLLALNFDIVAAEFEHVVEALQNANSTGWKLNEIPNGHWCIFPFIDQGVLVESNLNRCPNTAALICSLPALMKDCVFGNVAFSVLFPDSKIEPHCGPTNLRLRCHLGLSIPDGCWLEVAKKKQHWNRGDMIIFDDSFQHSAVYLPQPEERRATNRGLLMLDFWHPDITNAEKEVLLALLKP